MMIWRFPKFLFVFKFVVKTDQESENMKFFQLLFKRKVNAEISAKTQAQKKKTVYLNVFFFWPIVFSTAAQPLVYPVFFFFGFF